MVFLILVESISLSTKTSVSNQSPIDVHSFLATPANWPKIVLSSVAVVEASSSSSPAQTKATDVSKPYSVGDKVDEIFGLPPILPLKVQWTCTKSILPTKFKPGRLEFHSPDGLNGIASNCRMVFDIYSEEQQPADSSSSSSPSIIPSDVAAAVDLTMEYEPMSLIGILAVPILTVDNAFALKVLLPWTMNNVDWTTKSETMVPLDKFRRLMGTLYGIAGLAHLLDCTVGTSQLLTMAGSQPFYMLPFDGQIYAIMWCLMGPLSFVLSRYIGASHEEDNVGGGNLVLSDLGLVLYGLVETVGAGLISMHNNNNILSGDSASASMDPFVNAVLVQVVVALAWVYSSQQKTSN